MAKEKNRFLESIFPKETVHSEHASLAALAPIIQDREIFQPIHQKVKIDQKTIDYRPTDKLVFVTLGTLSGSENIYDINFTLRVDKPLLSAFGYKKCADQSVIQDTLDACTQDNVLQMESVLTQLFHQHSLCTKELKQSLKEQTTTTIDLDLSAQPASKNAQGSSKGYFSKKRNTYGRQLARVVFPSTSEIVTEGLYPGNTLSCEVFKEMVRKTERILSLETKKQRKLTGIELMQDSERMRTSIMHCGAATKFWGKGERVKELESWLYQ